jgi:DNA-binding GntR family transcriptional regulator
MQSIDRQGITPLKEPLHRGVTRELRRRILHAELPPGTKLNESRLAGELEVSRTPLREALHRLTQEGFLTVSPGRGWSVARLSSREVRELFAVIAELEVKALEWSGVPDMQSLTELTEINARFARATDVEHALALNGEWHRTLVRTCPNEHLRRFIEEIRLRVYRYEYYYFQTVAEHVETAAGLHRAVTDALVRGDLAAAHAAVRSHWLTDLDLMLPEMLDDRTVDRLRRSKTV